VSGQLQRVSVVGAVGCGKTTLAHTLAEQMGLPHVELDALRYAPSWVETPNETFVSTVGRIVQGDRWVIDGNYEIVRPLVWSRSQMVIWVDFPLRVVLWRLLSRTAYRLLTREEFANGNREQLSRLLGRRSILAWAIRSHEARRRHYQQQLLERRFGNLHVERLRSPSAVGSLMLRLSQSEPEGVR
jgi:adenylate kinase family enzyme